MRICWIHGIIFAAALAGTGSCEESLSETFRKEIADRASRAEQTEQTAIAGEDGWLFLTSELRSVGAGEFWGEAASSVSRASNPKYVDPLPAILDFHIQLKAAGIDLILVPVPPKAIIYPDRISSNVKADKGGMTPRLDTTHQKFYGILKEQGLTVLDLVPHLMKIRIDVDGNAYCQQDTHWTSRACEVTSNLILERVKKMPWFESVKKRSFKSEMKTVSINGDLRQMLKTDRPPQESIVLRKVHEVGSEGQPIEPWRESPVLLIGDSHTLVFHAGGDLHAQGAGLPDLLALKLGFPVDLIGVKGSGATTTRISIYRRRDNLQGKKLVIWCFTAREFTESFSGWRTVPVIRNK